MRHNIFDYPRCVIVIPRCYYVDIDINVIRCIICGLMHDRPMIPQALRYLTPPLLTQLDTHGHVRHLSRLCDYHLSAIILLH